MTTTMEQDAETRLSRVLDMVDRYGLVGTLELLAEACRVNADWWRLHGPTLDEHMADQWAQEAERLAAFSRHVAVDAERGSLPVVVSSMTSSSHETDLPADPARRYGRYDVQYVHLNGSVRSIERHDSLNDARQVAEWYRTPGHAYDVLKVIITDRDDPERGDLS